MKQQKPQICHHPDWEGEDVPAPAYMELLCECGENQRCPVCHFAIGAAPCQCGWICQLSELAQPSLDFEIPRGLWR